MKADDSTNDVITDGSADQIGPLHDEIRVTRHLDARWSAWSDGLRLTNDVDGTTTISGPVVDQAALHGLLQELREVAAPLISITQVGPDRSL